MSTPAALASQTRLVRALPEGPMTRPDRPNPKPAYDIGATDVTASADQIAANRVSTDSMVPVIRSPVMHFAKDTFTKPLPSGAAADETLSDLAISDAVQHVVGLDALHVDRTSSPNSMECVQIPLWKGIEVRTQDRHIQTTPRRMDRSRSIRAPRSGIVGASRTAEFRKGDSDVFHSIPFSAYITRYMVCRLASRGAGRLRLRQKNRILRAESQRAEALAVNTTALTSRLEILTS